jgi:hypothetical protein
MTVDDSIVHADPRSRRQAMVLLVVAVALGTAGIRWGLPWLEAARLTQPGVQRAICVTFAAVIVGLAALVVFSGRRIARLGRTTVELQRFPPPGMKVLRDLRRMTGAGAVLVGRGYVVIGWALVVLALLLLFLGGYMLVLLWPG